MVIAVVVGFAMLSLPIWVLVYRQTRENPKPDDTVYLSAAELVKQTSEGLAKGIRATLGLDLRGEVISNIEEEPAENIGTPDYADPFLREAEEWVEAQIGGNGVINPQQQTPPQGMSDL